GNCQRSSRTWSRTRCTPTGHTSPTRRVPWSWQTNSVTLAVFTLAYNRDVSSGINDGGPAILGAVTRPVAWSPWSPFFMSRSQVNRSCRRRSDRAGKCGERVELLMAQPDAGRLGVLLDVRRLRRAGDGQHH